MKQKEAILIFQKNWPMRAKQRNYQMAMEDPELKHREILKDEVITSGREKSNESFQLV